MKRIVAMVSVVLAAAIGFAADSADIVKVKGFGTGASEEAALKEAYRDAVESAVGVFVDAEQAAENDEIIKNQILTQSNAYIEDYDIVDKKIDGDMVQIKILARVKKQEITRKISSAMTSKAVSVGNALKAYHARETTTANRDGDALALFRNALEGIDPVGQLLEVSLHSPEGVPVEKLGRSSGSGTAEFAYLFKYEISRERYFKDFLPNLLKVLGQISVTEPREIVFNAMRSDSGRRGESIDLQKQIDSSKPKNTHQPFQGFKRGVYVLKLADTDPVDRRDRNKLREAQNKLRVVTEMNDSGTLVRGVEYTLDEQCAAFYRDWVKTFNGKNGSGSRKPQTRFGVQFLDGTGKTVAENDLPVERSRGDLFPFTSNLIAPLIGGDSQFYYVWRIIPLGMDDLPKIDSIKIELRK